MIAIFSDIFIFLLKININSFIPPLCLTADHNKVFDYSLCLQGLAPLDYPFTSGPMYLGLWLQHPCLNSRWSEQKPEERPKSEPQVSFLQLTSQTSLAGSDSAEAQQGGGWTRRVCLCGAAEVQMQLKPLGSRQHKSCHRLPRSAENTGSRHQACFYRPRSHSLCPWA